MKKKKKKRTRPDVQNLALAKPSIRDAPDPNFRSRLNQILLDNISH